MAFTSGRRGEPYSVASWRLYSPTFSAYFPRSDAQILKDLAGRFLMNLPGIFACIEHKFQRKADEVRRSRRFYGFFGGVVGMLLTPMIASANLITWLTEFAALVNTDYDVQVPVSEAFNSFVAFTAVLGGEVDSPLKFGAALLALYDKLLPEADVDPRLRQVLNLGIPELASAASRAFGIGTAGGQAISTQVLDALGVQNLASDVLTLVVRQLSNAIRSVGVREMRDFYDIALDLQNVPAKMLPFVLWAMKTLLLDDVMEAAAEEAGVKTTGDADFDAAEPIREEIKGQGEKVPEIVERPGRVTGTRIVRAAAGIGGGAAALFLPMVFSR